MQITLLWATAQFYSASEELLLAVKPKRIKLALIRLFPVSFLQEKHMPYPQPLNLGCILSLLLHGEVSLLKERIITVLLCMEYFTCCGSAVINVKNTNGKSQRSFAFLPKALTMLPNTNPALYGGSTGTKETREGQQNPSDSAESRSNQCQGFNLDFWG